MHRRVHGTRAAGLVALALAWSAAPAGAQTPQGIGLSEPDSVSSGRVVREEEWARTLAGALGLDEVLSESPDDAEVFALLCADAAEMATDAEGRRVPVRAAFRAGAGGIAPRAVGEPLRIVLDVPATALYQLSVEGTGRQRWSVDQRPVGHLDASGVGVGYGPRVIPLREGPHELTGILTRSSRADRVELVAYRPLCVAPAGGWRSGRPLTAGAQARTLVRSLGLEPHLPVAETVLDVQGEHFDSASEWGGRTNEPVEGSPRLEWAKAGTRPAEFGYRIRLDEPGVISFRARMTTGHELLWSIDDRYRTRARLEPGSERFGWAHVVTTTLSAGEHVIRALVPPGGGVDRIQAERLYATDADYLDLVEQMGFRLGGPRALATKGSSRRAVFHPAFQELAEDFLSRVAGNASEAPLVVLDDRLPPLYSRPLAPVLPSEL
jgi:hypothetical protein